MKLSKREKAILSLMVDHGSGPLKHTTMEELVTKVKSKSKTAATSLAGSMRMLQMKLNAKEGVVVERVSQLGRGRPATYAFRSKVDLERAKHLLKS